MVQDQMRLSHFEARALESGDWGGAAGGSAAGILGGMDVAGGDAANGAAGTMTLEHVRDFLNRKIDDLDFAMAKEDALRFIPPADAYKLDIWSADYFRELVKGVKVI